MTIEILKYFLKICTFDLLITQNSQRKRHETKTNTKKPLKIKKYYLIYIFRRLYMYYYIVVTYVKHMF